MRKQQSESNSTTQSSDDTVLSRRRFVALSVAGLGGIALPSSCTAVQGDADPEQVNAEPTQVKAEPKTSKTPDKKITTRTVVKNRAPLQDVPYVALPLGSVEARGWLLRQLELQRDGLTGHAGELLPAAKDDSAWLGGKGEDWEKGPYYIKGLVPLAYTLDDSGLKAKVQKWADAILDSQREDGFFGPKTNDDWWPRMVATYLLRDYAEATGETRVVPFLTKYYRHMAANLPKRPLREWGKARAGDEMDTVFWLYNRTGDAFLLGVADLLAQQAYAWRDIFTQNRFLEFGEDFHPKHNVNVPQAMKLPPVYWQRSHNPADRAAFNLGAKNLMRDHGLAMGINSGTEFLAGRSAAQGIELCSIVERMLSDETAMRILGDATIGDNLEQLAFNALPAALSTDIRQHVYFTLPNNPTAPRGKVGFTQDYDDARTPAPISGFPCCCYNFHMGWPKLAQNAWAATRDGGLAVMAYVPSEVTAQVAGGAVVTITEETDYPFNDTIRLRVSTPKKVRFPLALRIPAWCKNPSVSVNGKAQPPTKPGTFVRLDREWVTGDEVVLRFPMSVQTIPGVNNSVAVWRGPLLYSLKIEEKWSAFAKGNVDGFDSYEVTPTSDWNYALVLSEQPQAAFTVQQKPMPPNPFDPAQVPVRLQVAAKTIPDWTLTRDGHVAFDPPVSPVASSAPTQTVTLVPSGAQMLRVCNFPVIGTATPVTTRFRDDFADGHFDNWVTYGGGWLVNKGTFGPSPDATSSKAVATKTRFRDFTYDADVTVSGTGDAGLIFRVTKASIGADDYNGYYVGLSATAGQVTIGKADGKWTPLKMTTLPIAANRPHHVRIEARGALLRVFVGNTAKPLLEVTDNSFAEGAVGVRQYGAKPEQAQSAFSKINVVAS
ncbi:MAG: glycoside hydrolase family 127 protein [Fibrella sp.]|nr:glycoside hydrolase family 127 protein [Armatimonadota bacterium]